MKTQAPRSQTTTFTILHYQQHECLLHPMYNQSGKRLPTTSLTSSGGLSLLLLAAPAWLELLLQWSASMLTSLCEHCRCMHNCQVSVVMLTCITPSLGARVAFNDSMCMCACSQNHCDALQRRCALRMTQTPATSVYVHMQEFTYRLPGCVLACRAG